MLARAILLLACVVVAACSQAPESAPGWEHSRSGLYAAAISNDGRFAVVSSFSDGTSYWDLEANSRLFDWRHKEAEAGEIQHIAFSPDGSRVITADARTFVVWDTSTGQASGFWAADSDITDVALSAGGRHVLFGLKDGRAIHVDQRTSRRLEVVAHRDNRVSRVALSADGLTAITGGNDGRVMVWNSITGEELHAFQHGPRVVIIELDEAGRQLFTADKRGGVFVWDLDSGRRLATLKLDERQRTISAARFSPDGKRVLLGFPGGHVRLLDARSGRLVKAWRAPDRPSGWAPQRATVHAVAFNAGGHSVVAESSNGLGQTWPLAATR